MPGRHLYDTIYRFGAPWEMGPRPELVELVEGGRLTPMRFSPGRAVDLGCGSGANAVFLAEHGFEVTGIDFSHVALEKARRLATDRGVADHARWVRGDLTAEAIAGASGPFDLLVDYGTLDDLKGAKRLAMAKAAARLARPGAAFLLWCFYGDRAALPVFSFKDVSKAWAGLKFGEEEALFGAAFDIETLAKPEPGTHGHACFLLTRR